MLGTFLYVSILLVNAMAVLSEDRFLARIGWTSARPQNNNNNPAYQAYDQPGYGQEVGIKTKIIDLISAVRTLMRSTCPVLFTDSTISRIYSTVNCSQHTSYIVRTTIWRLKKKRVVYSWVICCITCRAQSHARLTNCSLEVSVL
ncbi:Yos1-like-domain-containing protein [Rhodocollybia butyracea]|uniref:Yos1-like-domain-containing protein n=1 Tax=Rhodocollybia butyracea TaxID=206335 RepID=A0A9P5Q765_9AGAR|nr:Yos1-like-domain-containing protein [Rhodocollybia butyracea]